MIKLALVGGASSWHGRTFPALLNGARKAVPEDWPQYVQCVNEARIVSVWDDDKSAAKELAEIFGIDHVASTLEESARDCDGVIITDDGSMQHQKRARYFLEAGISTFIDKPLALSITEAEELAALAARQSTPLMSCSALRFACETQELRDNPDLLGNIEFATAVCKGELFYYGIHALELAYSVLGSGIASVQNVGESGRDVVKIRYRDGRTLMLLVSESISYLFQLNLYGSDGWRQVVVEDDTAFYSSMLRQIARMVQERSAPVPVGETLEIIRVLDAAKRSRGEAIRFD